MGCKKFYLMPISIKRQMSAIKMAGIYTALCIVIFLLAMWMTIFRYDSLTALLLSAMFLPLILFVVLPGMRFDRVSQSTINFYDEKIEIADRNGVCWRSINYNTITAVRVEEVSGFFYGRNKNLFRNKYICIFLNGNTDLPQVSFAGLFKDKDFIMLGYDTDALSCIMGYVDDSKTKTGDGSPVTSKDERKTGDGSVSSD